MNKIKLVLADDHPLIREGFKSLLAKNIKFEIIGEAENGRELVEMASQLQPDVILTDVKMPFMSGLEAIEQLTKDFPLMKFIVLSMHDEREYIVNALKIGASGYLLKTIEGVELEKAIITVYEGGKSFSPIVTNILAEAVVKPEPNAVSDITPREKEVLNLVVKGNSTKQIADQLNISIRTVESHRINMLKKMKVSNTAELIKKAFDLKIIS
jgi:DNA-binding NarL/FixJ family response regulator